MTYDPAKDGAESYNDAIKAIRMQKIRDGEIIPWKRRVEIGNCVLYEGDCLEVMETLGKVDAVDFVDAVVYNQPYEKSAKRQHCSPTRSDENVGTEEGRNLVSVCERGEISTADGGQIWGDVGGFSKSNQAHGYTREVTRQEGRGERQVQGRKPINALPTDGCEEQVQSLRNDRAIVNSSHGSQSHEQRAREPRGSLQPLPHEPPQNQVVALPKGWAILTDPPYGIGAAQSMSDQSGRLCGHGGRRVKKKIYANKDWDNKPADMSWLNPSGQPAIIWGGNYFDLPPSSCWLVWDKENGFNNFADCELAWTNLPKAVRKISWLWNGMARKNLEKRFDHPTQKPLGVMEWCINHLPADAETILDPFMGSGTTLVACAKMGRSGIGIELDPDYFDIACERVRKAYEQPDFFTKQPEFKEEIQGDLL